MPVWIVQKPRSLRILLRWIAVSVALVLIVTGCRSIPYYQQAISGQVEILAKREKIETILARNDVRPALREKLELILGLREFAQHDLNLKPDGQYLCYADLGRRFVVWNVYAAPEFSLEPKKWWYPVVGSLKYRGFFSEKEARDYGAHVAKEGYDVFIGGVDAYSTLGFFKDPVLNTFIHYDAPELAEIIFHELAHQRVFAAGDTDFNEAFATAVGEEGARRWLAARGTDAARAAYATELQRKDQFVHLVMQARERLKKVYGEETAHKAHATAAPGSEPIVAVKRAGKQKVLDQLRRDYAALKASWGGYDGYDHWFSRSLNNAQLNTVATYYNLVPALTRLLNENRGDLEGFYSDCKVLARMPKDQRKGEMEKLLQQGALARIP
jgi:predicted aminopeptidase